MRKGRRRKRVTEPSVPALGLPDTQQSGIEALDQRRRTDEFAFLARGRSRIERVATAGEGASKVVRSAGSPAPGEQFDEM